jgi:DNA-binding GntR family transcriptional regulator
MTAGRDVAAQPLYEVIYEVLRDHLAAGRFPAGLVLGEANVARAFATSRVPAAAALKRLREEGLLSDFDGRGYLAGNDGSTPPLRKPLDDAGLELPEELRARLGVRTTPGRIYPDVEHTVASCLAYGRFMLNESALAEHYGVSRAVAHDVLTRLERTGIVSQDSNQRWYAGPLTADLVREHFEMRWLLEPAALIDAAPRIPRVELVRKQGHVAHLKNGHKRPRLLERIEEELHIELVERCRNSQLKFAVRRSQLPLFATHSTYRRHQDAEEIVRMAAEHWTVFDHLLAGNVEDAALTLEAHLKRSVEHNVEVLQQLPPLPETALPAYLVPIRLRRSEPA